MYWVGSGGGFLEWSKCGFMKDKVFATFGLLGYRGGFANRSGRNPKFRFEDFIHVRR